MIGNNSMVSEWKKKKLQTASTYPAQAFFGSILFLVVRATNSLLTISSWIFPELSPCVNGQESVYPYSVNAEESRKMYESGTIYESGQISSSVNLV